MRLAEELTGQPAKILPVVASALERSGEHEILDLCSGGAGPILWMARELRRRGRPIQVTLTDLYPSEGAREIVAARAPEVRYESDPLDASGVPAERAGLRTIMNAFHHFRPFRAAWIPLTYLVPVLPLFMLWDVMVSTLRTYTTDEFLALARAADPDDSFDWQAHERPVIGPLRGIALVGIPRERLGGSQSVT